MKSWQAAVGAVTIMAASSTLAEGWDGSEPVICAITEGTVCEPGRDCVQGTARVINLPLFIKIDFESQTVRTAKEVGEGRVSAINTAVNEDGVLTVQGAESGTTWGMSINVETGSMSFSAASEATGYVAFGACTVL